MGNKPSHFFLNAEESVFFVHSKPIEATEVQHHTMAWRKASKAPRALFLCKCALDVLFMSVFLLASGGATYGGAATKPAAVAWIIVAVFDSCLWLGATYLQVEFPSFMLGEPFFSKNFRRAYAWFTAMMLFALAAPTVMTVHYEASCDIIGDNFCSCDADGAANAAADDWFGCTTTGTHRVRLSWFICSYILLAQSIITIAWAWAYGRALGSIGDNAFGLFTWIDKKGADRREYRTPVLAQSNLYRRGRTYPSLF